MTQLISFYDVTRLDGNNLRLDLYLLAGLNSVDLYLLFRKNILQSRNRQYGNEFIARYKAMFVWLKVFETEYSAIVSLTFYTLLT